MAEIPESQFPDMRAANPSGGSGKGCLWGCLLVAGLGVSLVLCAGIGSYWFLSSTIAKYTADAPAELPTVEYDEAQMSELENRIETFQQELKSGQPPADDLVLTAEEINALIATNEDFRGRVFVEIVDGQVKGDVSFPLSQLPGGSGRYFNGSATFDVSMEDGVLIVTAQQAEVNGSPVPDTMMQGIRQENLAKDLYKDAENARFMRQFEDIRIEDDKFILRVKRDQEAGESAAADDASSDATPPTAPQEAEPAQDDLSRGPVPRLDDDCGTTMPPSFWSSAGVASPWISSRLPC